MRALRSTVVLSMLMLLGSMLTAGPAVAEKTEWAGSGGNGHFYEVVPAQVTWDIAMMAAEDTSFLGLPGHLVTITSLEEQAFVNSLFDPSFNRDAAWMGLFDAVSEPDYPNTWEWVSGEVFDWSNWNTPNEPNGGITDNCAGFYPTHPTVPGGVWNDFSCAVTTQGVMAYVVEYDFEDSDGDGVYDHLDECPGTVLPDDDFEDRRNRYSADADGDFVDPNGRMANISVVDTYGCSGEDIVLDAGFGGKGHMRFGPTKSLLLNWIAGHA